MKKMTLDELKKVSKVAEDQLKAGIQLPEHDFSDIPAWKDIVYTTVNKMIAYRLKNNLRQDEIAARMGVKQSMISRFENLGRIPTVELMYKYADALGLKLYLTPFGDRTITLSPEQAEKLKLCGDIKDTAQDTTLDKIIDFYLQHNRKPKPDLAVPAQTVKLAVVK